MAKRVTIEISESDAFRLAAATLAYAATAEARRGKGAVIARFYRAAESAFNAIGEHNYAATCDTGATRNGG